MIRLLPQSSWSTLLDCSRSILQFPARLPRFLQLLLLILVSGLSNLSAQPGLQNEGSRIVTLPSGERVFEWYGKLGRAYFIQVSDPSDHLNKWKWSNVIERGNNQAISHEISSTADKAFFRLQYTDQVAADLDIADFDGDGLTNLQEITPVTRSGGSTPRTIGGVSTPNTTQTNPLNGDTDGDGLSDKFERDNGLDPTDNGLVDPNNEWPEWRP